MVFGSVYSGGKRARIGGGAMLGEVVVWGLHQSGQRGGCSDKQPQVPVASHSTGLLPLTLPLHPGGRGDPAVCIVVFLSRLKYEHCQVEHGQVALC